MQKITPFLWFNDNAEEAANFYTSLFKNSKTGTATKYSEASAKASGRPAGSVMTISLQLEGYGFTAINGGQFSKLILQFHFSFILKMKKKLTDFGKNFPTAVKY